MEGIYKRLFPAVLQLGCDIEQVRVTDSLHKSTILHKQLKIFLLRQDEFFAESSLLNG